MDIDVKRNGKVCRTGSPGPFASTRYFRRPIRPELEPVTSRLSPAPGPPGIRIRWARH
jgi:hypothetical protein